MEQYMQNFFYELSTPRLIEISEEESYSTMFNNRKYTDQELNFTNRYLDIDPSPLHLSNSSHSLRYPKYLEEEENEMVNPDFFLNPVLLE
jgi:hypothetical protein